MNNIDIEERVAYMLHETFVKSGYTLPQMAKLMNVSRSTIYNWTNGIGCPSLIQTIKWFNVLHIQMIPWLMGLFYLRTDTSESSDKNVDAKLQKIISSMTNRTKNKLAFIFSGNHGSSPSGLIEMTVAYLHLPLERRLSICNTILLEYDLTKSNDKSSISPDIETLKKSFDHGKQACLNGLGAYNDISQ